MPTADATRIMGVLNVTPDSFSDGGKFTDVGRAVEHAQQMVRHGADIIDVGGESSRPGSDPVSEEEELARVGPVIERLAGEVSVPISIDTYKPRVAEACLKLGARMVNDISGLRSRGMIEVVVRYQVAVVIMHMQGESKAMQDNPTYNDVVDDVKGYLAERCDVAKQAGVDDIIVDPGIGFGKTLEDNLSILSRLAEFVELGYPVLVGPSRKSFIGTLTNLPVDQRVEGTLAAVVVSVMHGASLVRVHDVKECARALKVVDAIRADALTEVGVAAA